MWSNWNSHNCWQECKLIQSLWKTTQQCWMPMIVYTGCSKFAFRAEIQAQQHSAKQPQTGKKPVSANSSLDNKPQCIIQQIVHIPQWKNHHDNNQFGPPRHSSAQDKLDTKDSRTPRLWSWNEGNTKLRWWEMAEWPSCHGWLGGGPSAAPRAP